MRSLVVHETFLECHRKTALQYCPEQLKLGLQNPILKLNIKWLYLILVQSLFLSPSVPLLLSIFMFAVAAAIPAFLVTLSLFDNCMYVQHFVLLFSKGAIKTAITYALYLYQSLAFARPVNILSIYVVLLCH